MDKMEAAKKLYWECCRHLSSGPDIEHLLSCRAVLAAERQAAALERIAAALEHGRDLAERSDEP